MRTGSGSWQQTVSKREVFLFYFGNLMTISLVHYFFGTKTKNGYQAVCY